MPDNVSEYKCLAEPVMCCCNIVHAVEMKKEDGWLAVVGCGYMGQVCLSLLHAYGVKNIVAFDLHEERRISWIQLPEVTINNAENRYKNKKKHS